MKPFAYKILFLVILFLSSPSMVNAQCAMCRAALETGEDQSAASGINHGITYLMAFPYILGGVLAYVIYRIIKKENSTSS